MTRIRRLGENPRNLLTSLVLVFPLLLAYQVGVLFTLPMLNGADFLTTLLFRTLHLSVREYLAFIGLVWVAFLVGVFVLRRKQRFNARILLPVLLESSIYALSMGSVIILVMTRVLGISPQLAASAGGTAAGIEGQGILTKVVMSLGAGVYEEAVFRLGLLGGLAALLEKAAGWGRWFAVGVALALSSFLFSAVHHIPPLGDPLSLGVFTFRVLAGIFFGLLFWFRGFAVAVYTHALYDVYVLLVR
jgi:membrane protease YdiL (CAAX protease family)